MLSNALLKYFAVFGLSAGIVISLTPLFIKLAPRIGLIDHPNERRIHKKPIPLGAGIVLFVSFNLTCYAIYQYIWPSFDNRLNADWWRAFFISSVILLLVGLVDDRRGMSAPTKLAGQVLATSCLYFLSGYRPELLNVDFGLMGGWLFVLFWTLAIVNAFNLIDGLDGLCSGLAMISSAGLAAVFIFRGFPGDALICLALVGSCLAFLRYNFHPAKVFLGDTGSMFLGFALASISLHAGGKGSFFIFIASPFFVAGVPIIDTLLAIWRRSIRKMLAKKNGEPSSGIMQADREHLHHRLLDSGLKQHHVAYALYCVNILVVAVGLSYFMLREISTGLFLIIFIVTLYLLIRHVLHIELWETSRLLLQDEDKPVVSKLSFMLYPLFDLSWMAFAVWLSGFIALTGNMPFSSMGDWFSQLPLWIAPTFCLLSVTDVYAKVWRNSFFRDYLCLSFAIIIGSLLSLGVLFMANRDHGVLMVNQAMLFCFLGYLGIMGIRVPSHFLREWGISNRNNGVDCPRNILIYGAGAHGGLYLRERHLKYGSELGTVCIVGFIDDDKRLHNQYTFGLKVLGDVHDLESIAKKASVSEVILSTTISEENFRALKRIAADMNIALFEWKAGTSPIA